MGKLDHKMTIMFVGKPMGVLWAYVEGLASENGLNVVQYTDVYSATAFLANNNWPIAMVISTVKQLIVENYAFLELTVDYNCNCAAVNQTANEKIVEKASKYGCQIVEKIEQLKNVIEQRFDLNDTNINANVMAGQNDFDQSDYAATKEELDALLEM